MPFGLSQQVIDQIRGVLAQHPNLEEAIVYGSRAKGNYKTGSDIDLCFKGEALDFATLARIAEELDQLPIPYLFDLSIFATLDNPDLIAHINRVGQVFYAKPNPK
ncbi:MAG: nucleotidyltransferase domain-containing protein [bacterium]|nr:nucleotidyltransferase domain-containing protein [bacterium]